MWFDIFRSKKDVPKDLSIELVAMAEVIAELKKENQTLNDRCNQYFSELQHLRQQISNGTIVCDTDSISSTIINSYIDNMLVKYRICEDDTYCRVISEQDIFTVSFRREFNTTKGNHNWVDKDSAFITLYLDNTGRNFLRPTLIKSPADGIFESSNNKLIKKGEEICRIRKYNAEEKSTVIATLEREAIKEGVLKRELKKMIERETMDELISEGKIFNVVISKEGNRMTIPLDIANAVWNRDGGCCCLCGARSELEFDHIIPVSKGGATTFRNLQLLCHKCNLKKSHKI